MMARLGQATEKLQETMGVHCLQHSRLYVDVDVGPARVARTREVEFHPTSPAWNQSFRLHCAYPAAAVTFTLHRQEPAPRRRGRPRRRLRARRARRLGAAGRVLARPPRRRARPRDALLARAGEPPRPHLRARQAHDRYALAVLRFSRLIVVTLEVRASSQPDLTVSCFHWTTSTSSSARRT